MRACLMLFVSVVLTGCAGLQDHVVKSYRCVSSSRAEVPEYYIPVTSGIVQECKQLGNGHTRCVSQDRVGYIDANEPERDRRYNVCMSK